jgi:Ca2+-binding EF-hand superfamily protein
MITGQKDYEAKAKALIDWAEKKIVEFNEAKFGETLDSVTAANGVLRTYIKGEKPDHSIEKLDLEDLYTELQTELKVNDRSPYTAPEGHSLDDIDAVFVRLSTAEKDYGKRVRAARFRFIKKEESKLSEEQIAEFEASFKKFDVNGNEQLSADEFRASLTVLGCAYPKEQKAFDAYFGKIAGDNEEMSKEQYFAFLTALKEDKDDPIQIKESFKALSAGKDTISAQQLQQNPITEEQAKFLASVMESSENGYAYADFVDSQFV